MGYSFEADRYQIRQLVESFYRTQTDMYDFDRTRKNLGDAHRRWIDMLTDCVRQIIWREKLSPWALRDFLNSMLLGVDPDRGGGEWFTADSTSLSNEEWEQHVSRATVDRFGLDANVGESVLEFFCEEDYFEPVQAHFLRNREVQDALMELDSWVIFEPNSAISDKSAHIPSIAWDSKDAPGLILCALYVDAVNAYVTGKNLRPVTPAKLLLDLFSAAFTQTEDETLRFNDTVNVQELIASYTMPPTQVEEVVSPTYPKNVWRHEIKGAYTLAIETPKDGVTVLTITAEKE